MLATSILERRIAAEKPVLHELLRGLYGQHGAFDSWFDSLFAQICAAAQTRRSDLIALDLQREAQPDWHQSEKRLGYCAYVDRFGGNLRGIIQRIPHLQQMGVTYLHLLPFMQAGTPPNDGGFAVASYTEVEPALGTQQDLSDLLAALRHAGIGLCCDFVLNHVSQEHPWALAAKAGSMKHQNYFHVLPSAEQVQAYERDLGQVFPATAPGNFTLVSEVKGWVWTTFYPYQWDLNYANPQVFAEIVQAMLHLANLGIESLRLDSAAFMWKRAGTNCMNQPEVHALLQALRAIINIAAPGSLLKAEAIVPTKDIPPYFGLGAARGRECHVAYHASLMAASWYALQAQDTTVLADVIAHTPALPPGGSWLTYVRCHDDIVWGVIRAEVARHASDERSSLVAAAQFFSGDSPGSYAAGTNFQVSDPSAVHGTNGMGAALAGLTKATTPEQVTQALERITLLYSLACFFGGMPVLYMGDEMALQNTTLTALDTAAGLDGRQIHRPHMPADFAQQLQHKGSAAAQLYAQINTLLRARQQTSALAADKSRVSLATGTPQVLGLLRDGTHIGLFNFSEQSQRVQLPATQATMGSSWRDLLGGTRYTAPEIVLAPRASVWLVATTA